MQISECQNYKPRVHFNGLTSKLRKTNPKCMEDIRDMFIKYQKSDGIAGSLPSSWIERISSKSKDEKGSAIKTIYAKIREIVQNLGDNASSKNELKKASKELTETMRKTGFLPKTNSVFIQERKVFGGVMSKALTIHEYGKNPSLQKLFIKKYIPHEDLPLVQAQNNGLLPELSLGLRMNYVHKNRHNLRIYWGDYAGNFMVSEYLQPVKNVKIPTRWSLYGCYNAWENFFEKLKKLTRDDKKISEILRNRGYIAFDLHDCNVMVCKDKKGLPVVKILDYGDILKLK